MQLEEDPILNEETTLSLLLRREAETHRNKIPIIVFVVVIALYILLIVKGFEPLFYLVSLVLLQFSKVTS
jgi:hypothetical protein